MAASADTRPAARTAHVHSCRAHPSAVPPQHNRPPLWSPRLRRRSRAATAPGARPKTSAPRPASTRVGGLLGCVEQLGCAEQLAWGLCPRDAGPCGTALAACLVPADPPRQLASPLCNGACSLLPFRPACPPLRVGRGRRAGQPRQAHAQDPARAAARGGPVHAQGRGGAHHHAQVGAPTCAPVTHALAGGRRGGGGQRDGWEAAVCGRQLACVCLRVPYGSLQPSVVPAVPPCCPPIHPCVRRDVEGAEVPPGADPWAYREFFIKWARSSYLHCTWELRKALTPVGGAAGWSCSSFRPCGGNERPVGRSGVPACLWSGQRHAGASPLAFLVQRVFFPQRGPTPLASGPAGPPAAAGGLQACAELHQEVRRAGGEARCTGVAAGGVVAPPLPPTRPSV